MSYCPTCGQPLQPDAKFCAECGASIASEQPAQSAQRGLAQAGLEVQAFNLWLSLGRVAGLVAAGLLVWFVVGPALEREPLWLIGAILGLALLGILGGQWVTLLLLRR